MVKLLNLDKFEGSKHTLPSFYSFFFQLDVRKVNNP